MEKVYKWFKSELTNTTQCVKVQSTYSKMGLGYVKYGVPLVTVLGAVLFLVSINDLCNANLNGKLTSFPDDTALC